MREVRFKNKEAKHSLNVQGKMISFKDGVAKVNDNEAEAISKLDNSDYEVVPTAEPKEKPSKPVKKSRKPKKK